MDLNTCYETTNAYHAIAYYSHIIPVAISLFLSGYALFRTKFSKLSILFFGFTFTFSLWLLGSLVTWVTPNYDLVYFFWSWLDYINVVFFALGAYFFCVLARGQLSLVEKIVILAVSAPALWMTVTGNSVTDFFQPWCEATENNAITTYKLFAEGVFVVIILYSLILGWKGSSRNKKIQLSTVASAVLLFFAVFSVTEYIATVTDVYEISLYGLFVLPLFLVAMVFAISNLKVFDLRHLGTQILIYVLILMVASQYLFLEGSTDKILNSITLAVTMVFGYFLLRVAKREFEQRERIEKLAQELAVANNRLVELDKQKTEFLSIASHQLRAPLTSIKGYSSMILEGSFGEISKEVRGAVDVVFQSSQKLVTVIEDFLNITRIELGKMKYEMNLMNFRQLVEMVLKEQKNIIASRGLQLSFEAQDGGNYQITGDSGKLSQVVSNLIDNAAKYTKQGGIKVNLAPAATAGKVRLTVTDTGIGLTPETISHLFEKFTRAKDAGKVNIIGTGLGLYVAKQIVEGHQGKIWAESEGPGKGSSFIVEI